jgi:DNA-binding transcriptional regulator YhcF (GntR family)
MKAAVSRIRRERLHDQMIRQIALGIMRGDIGQGELSTEGDLCRHFQVSRTILREAVKVLAAKGLIELRPKTGMHVRPRSEWNLVDPDLLAHNLGLTKGQLASMIGLPGDSLYRRERIKASKTQSRMREVIEILMRVVRAESIEDLPAQLPEPEGQDVVPHLLRRRMRRISLVRAVAGAYRPADGERVGVVVSGTG